VETEVAAAWNKRRPAMTSKPVLEPSAQQFADSTANPPFLFDLGPGKGRETVDQVQSGDIAKPDVDVTDTTVPGGASGEVSVRIVRPRGTSGTLPVIVYIHGAGWVFGNAHTHDRLVRELAVSANAAVVFPNYSLSPEAKYPTAIEESYSVAAWSRSTVPRRTTGIGRAAAIALASEGYEVTIVGRTAATLEETVTRQRGRWQGQVRHRRRSRRGRRPPCHRVRCRWQRRRWWPPRRRGQHRGVDGGNDSPPFIDYPVESLDLMLATNVRGMLFSMKHELEIMAKQGFGSIVNISSGAGLTGVPGYAGYVASKHAEIGLTKSAALGYADRSVRVDAVCSGLVNTALIADMVTENREMHEHLVASHPLGRIVEPEEIADSNRLAGHQQVQLCHRRRTARGRRLPRALTRAGSGRPQETQGESIT
jgi:NAD(P)-dependent dehydrogenase (short-subunit alcohol dehydrogenase family)